MRTKGTLKPPVYLLVGLLICNVLLADNYYVVDLSQLEFSKPTGKTLSHPIRRHAWSHLELVQFPQLIIGGETVEAYVGFPTQQEDANRNWWRSEPQSTLQVALRVPEKEIVKGVALLAAYGEPIMQSVDFTFDPNTFEEASRQAFQQVRQSHYQRLALSNAPGGHWFRFKAGEIKTSQNLPRTRNNGSFESTFQMFSGNRAVSENLALDRELILATEVEGEPSNISTIAGVTVNAIDWKERLSDHPTDIDTLASVIPHDQHIALFPSIKSLNQVLKCLESDGITVFQSFANRGQYAKLANRYQQQMGILLPEMVAEQLPVESVAITGGDPFLPSGSDVTVLFETKEPKLLFDSLDALIQVQAQLHGAEAQTDLAFQTTTARAYTTLDRSFSSIVFLGDNYVAVTNSPMQFKRLSQVSTGEIEALGTTDEFKFFRQRYPKKDVTNGFVFLSDATIRRWSGPEFRVGASRRVRAAAVLGEAQAQIIAGETPSDTYSELVGALEIENQTAQSPIYNTLAFLTPISELEITTVTPSEKQAYERWRRGYESGWVVFDPIALQINITESSHEIDLSVIPLRIGSRYDDWVKLAGTAKLDRVALTPHKEALMMLSFAIDSRSELFKMADLQSQSMLPGMTANPLAWIGESFSIYADADPFWEELSEQQDVSAFMQSNFAKLPIGIRVSSQSVTRLALFLTGLRSMSQQAAPGLLAWETREHKEQPYVVIQTTESAPMGDMEIKIHYAALPDAFLLSLNEEVLKRAITRNLANSKETIPAEPEQSYQAFANVQVEAVPQYLKLMGEDPLKAQQLVSWSALPILNEWHRLYPDQDPVAVHAANFHEQIRCPGGQGYEWNASKQNMESVAYGTPDSPRGEVTPLPILQNWLEAEASLNFEDDGLRLKARLTK